MQESLAYIGLAACGLLVAIVAWTRLVIQPALSKYA
jgi:hypothetical protein